MNDFYFIRREDGVGRAINLSHVTSILFKDGFAVFQLSNGETFEISGELASRLLERLKGESIVERRI
jgi:hypothetical protein